MGYASLADGVDRAQAGLEPGFEDMYTGLDTNGFAANMAMRDDIASASVVGGRQAGFQALAKYRTQTGSIRPNERALLEARQQQGRLGGVPPAPSFASSAGRPARGLGRPNSPSLGGAGSAIASRQAQPIASNASVPAAKAKPAPKAKAAVGRARSAGAGGGQRLGGLRVHDQEAMRLARLRALDGGGGES